MGVVFALVIGLVLGPFAVWIAYFKYYKKHDLVELVSTEYVPSALTWSWLAFTEGRITPTMRVELRGGAAAERAKRVRNTAPALEPMFARTTMSATPQLINPDVLLDVSYAPNVPHGAEGAASAPSAAAAAPAAPQVVDLSNATEVSAPLGGIELGY